MIKKAGGLYAFARARPPVVGKASPELGKSTGGNGLAHLAHQRKDVATRAVVFREVCIRFDERIDNRVGDALYCGVLAVAVVSRERRGVEAREIANRVLPAHRVCELFGLPTAGATCAVSPLVTSATGNQEVAGRLQLSAPSLVYYRITARIAGPRNTVSYVQATVAL